MQIKQDTKTLFNFFKVYEKFGLLMFSPQAVQYCYKNIFNTDNQPSELEINSFIAEGKNLSKDIGSIDLVELLVPITHCRKCETKLYVNKEPSIVVTYSNNGTKVQKI